ncbi:hypothetical protein ACZ87_02118 [Candidatus Erwinia dacicola]|uniref:Uncharacterized protein n=1 Tax=Candidatus Erwinia dacicola TaxID=252393 RepID=A0A328TTI6_9GAMM|nr:hypothetical protein ACZ87_02118 [Candidatus Erwinia dacicola]
MPRPYGELVIVESGMPNPLYQCPSATSDLSSAPTSQLISLS